MPIKPIIFIILKQRNNNFFHKHKQNISLSGIFLKAKDKFRVEQTIILSLPSKTKKAIKIRGEVVWSNHEGCGVKFLKKKGE